MNAKTTLAIGLIVFGGLVVAFSVWVEPSGELHGSVLAFWGETLTATLLLFGIRVPTKSKTKKKTDGDDFAC